VGVDDDEDQDEDEDQDRAGGGSKIWDLASVFMCDLWVGGFFVNYLR
jgi:hypothetical protein